MYPGVPLITANDWKLRVGLEADDDTYDEVLDAQMRLVTFWFEQYCQRGLARRVIVGEKVEDRHDRYRIHLWAFPVTLLSKVVVDDVQQPLDSFHLNAARGILTSKTLQLSAAERIEVDYTAGYATSEVPDDLAHAYALAVAARVGRTVSVGGSSTGSAAIKSIGLGGGALSVTFDTARQSGGFEGVYDVDDVPPDIQPYAATLDYYRRINV